MTKRMTDARESYFNSLPLPRPPAGFGQEPPRASASTKTHKQNAEDMVTESVSKASVSKAFASSKSLKQNAEAKVKQLGMGAGLSLHGQGPEKHASSPQDDEAAKRSLVLSLCKYASYRQHSIHCIASSPLIAKVYADKI